MSKRRPEKQRPKHKKRPASRQKQGRSSAPGVDITYDALPDPDEDRLPEPARERYRFFSTLRDRRLLKDHVVELEELVRAYPDLPRLYNFLFGGYMELGQFDKADAIALENYRRHPGYLYARLNYASLCLGREQTDEFPGIFGNVFSLRALYPERTVFHVTEVLNFYGVVGKFFLQIGELGPAALCLETLWDVDEEHPLTLFLKEELTAAMVERERLKKALEPSLKRLL